MQQGPPLLLQAPQRAPFMLVQAHQEFLMLGLELLLRSVQPPVGFKLLLVLRLLDELLDLLPEILVLKW